MAIIGNTARALVTWALLCPVAGQAVILESIESNPEQSVFIEGANLSAKEFFSLYTSSDTLHKRYADLYLLGVVDATEKTQWCDYTRLKTISINEFVYEGLKKLVPSRGNERASRLIVEVLHTHFRCKGK